MRRSHLVYISVNLADNLSNCLVVQLPTVNVRNVDLHANTSTQTVSPCIDSSVNNVLLQSPDQSRLQPVASWVHPHSWMSSDRPTVAWPPRACNRPDWGQGCWGLQIQRDKVRGFALQQLDRFVSLCAGALSRWNMNVSPARHLIAGSTAVSK